MKILNFGSLNIDYVYDVAHFVQPGETETSPARHIFPGGKGLNQSLAGARAGARVIHGGAIGADGEFLANLLSESGADASRLMRLQEGTGHAVIQVTPQGQNAILVYGGANRMLTEEYILSTLENAETGDFVLLQNETNLIDFVMKNAKEKGMRVVFNPSPFPENIEKLPLDCVQTFIVNEIEGAKLANLPEDTEPEKILSAMAEKYPAADIVLTLGSRGVTAKIDGKVYSHPIFKVKAADTTAAGDTFCGYYLAGRCGGLSPDACLRRASAASAIAVTRNGAAPSIPTADEVDEFLKNA